MNGRPTNTSSDRRTVPHTAEGETPVEPISVKRQLSQFSREAFTYGLASALASLLGLLALPFLTSALAPGEYVPGAIAFWVATSSDRILLGVMTDAEQVGLYAVAALIALALAVLTQAFRMAWGPYAFAVFRRPGYDVVLSTIVTWVVWAALSVAVLLAVLSPWIVDVVASPEYARSASAVPFLLFGELATIGTVGVAIGANLARTTLPVAAALIIGAVVNVGANLVLIPVMGFDGAALATLIGMSAGAVFMYVASQRLHPLPYPLRRLLTLILVGGFLVLVARTLPDTGAFALAARAGLALSMLAMPTAVGLGNAKDLWTLLRPGRLMDSQGGC